MARQRREDTEQLMTVQMPEDSGAQVSLNGNTLDLDEDNCVQVNAADAALLINSHGGQPFRPAKPAPRAPLGEPLKTRSEKAAAAADERTAAAEERAAAAEERTAAATEERERAARVADEKAKEHGKQHPFQK